MNESRVTAGVGFLRCWWGDFDPIRGMGRYSHREQLRRPGSSESHVQVLLLQPIMRSIFMSRASELNRLRLEPCFSFIMYFQRAEGFPAA